MPSSKPPRKLAVALAWAIPTGILLLLGLAGVEMVARQLYRRTSTHFGVEMWKYAKNLKIPAVNPEMSHCHRPNSHAVLMGVEININSIGLRDHEIDLHKPRDTCRIVVLGDSTTFGWGVPFEQTYPKLLEKSFNTSPPSLRWKHYEVVNTGIGNYNTTQEVAAFKERWLALEPDLILIAWYINDAEPTPKPRQNWLAYHSYGYGWLTSNFDALRRNVGEKQRYREYYRDLYRDQQPGWQKSQSAFAELAGICRQRNIPMHILLIPELHSLAGNYEFTAIHDLLREVGAKNGVPVLDLIGSFPASGDPTQFWASSDDAHPNGKAHELMAARIENALQSERWLK